MTTLRSALLATLFTVAINGCGDSKTKNNTRAESAPAVSATREVPTPPAPAASTRSDGQPLKTSQPGNAWQLAAGQSSELKFTPANAPAWDASQFSALRMNVRNTGRSPATVRARITNQGATALALTCQTAATLLPGDVRELNLIIVPTPVDPGFEPFAPYMMYYDRIHVRDNTVDPSKIDALTVWLEAPAADASVEISSLELHGNASPKRTSFFPFIDRYGQYIHADWPGKIRTDADFAQRRIEEEKERAAWPGPGDRGKFGGWASGPQLRATGNFYVSKYEGKWWLVDPEGKLFWSYGPTGAGFGSEITPITGRESWFEQLPARDAENSKFFAERSSAPSRYYKDRDWVGFFFYALNLERKYGTNSKEELKRITVDRLRSWGFNSLGNWSSSDMMAYGRVPYVTPIHYGSPMVDDHMPDAFSPQWEENLRIRLEKERNTTAKDPWNIGYFVDNERRWGKFARAAGVALKTLECPATSPAKNQFINDLKTKYTTIESLNQSWGTTHSSWDALLGSREKMNFENPKNPNLAKDCGDFGEKFAEKYFSTCRRLLKAVAPNHLYLGVRLNGHIDPSLIKLQTKYCDVISYNMYDATPTSRLSLYDEIDFPFLASEWGIDNDARQSPFRASKVQVAIGRTGDRCEAMVRYAKAAIQHPKIVGAHFFQYRDQPISGRPDGEALLRGFVNVADTPNFELVQANRKLAYDLYRDRANAKSQVKGD